MPKPLLVRIGPDTTGKLELAAVRRHAEAGLLRRDEPLGALYLYGYTIEMRLKAAYYRLTHVPMNWDISAKTPGQASSPRHIAEDAIRTLLGLPPKTPVGHHLTGWASLVIATRRNHLTLGPLSATDETALSTHALNAALHRKEVLRYHPNRPYDWELEEVAAAARWVKGKYRLLWS